MPLKMQSGFTMATIKEAIIDANVLIALIDRRDNWNHRAQALMTALYDQDVRPLFLDCVMNEAISVLARRSEERKRTDEFSNLLNELTQRVPEARIIWVSNEMKDFYSEIIALVRSTNGTMNVHDAFIALLCQTFNIPFILSFDKDFDQVDWLTRIADADALRTAFAN